MRYQSEGNHKKYWRNHKKYYNKARFRVRLISIRNVKIMRVFTAISSNKRNECSGSERNHHNKMITLQT